MGGTHLSPDDSVTLLSGVTCFEANRDEFFCLRNPKILTDMSRPPRRVSGASHPFALDKPRSREVNG